MIYDVELRYHLRDTLMAALVSQQIRSLRKFNLGLIRYATNFEPTVHVKWS